MAKQVMIKDKKVYFIDKDKEQKPKKADIVKDSKPDKEEDDNISVKELKDLMKEVKDALDNSNEMYDDITNRLNKIDYAGR